MKLLDFRNVQLLGILLGAFVIAGTATMADVPNAPHLRGDLQTSIDANGNESTTIDLWMSANRNDDVSGYYVYLATADGNSNGTPAFERIAETTKPEFSYPVEEIGAYAFYVTAFNDDGESKQSPVLTFVYKGDSDNGGINRDIHFRTQPKPFGVAGELWEYDVDAVYPRDKDAALVYSLREAPDGMRIDEESGLINWTPNENGVYSVVVVAALKDNPDISGHQEFRILIGRDGNDDPRRHHIVFDRPHLPDNVAVGDEYSVDFDAYYSEDRDAKVVYALDKGPDGMELDPETGIVKWVPSEDGRYSATIRAYLADNEDINAVMTWIISVGEINNPRPDVCATISGTVSDEAGNAIEFGMLQVVARGDRNKPNPDGTIAGWAGFTRVIDGQYSLDVPAGSYYIIVQAEGYQTEYYDNATEFADAEMLTVECDDKAEANFILDKLPEPVRYSISGKVVDTDGNPVVSLVRAIIRDARSADGRNFAGHLHTRTDENGNYELNVTDNFSYVLQATPLNSNHMPQFYDGVAAYQDATVLEPEGNLTDIDFVLEALPSYDNAISGTVTDENSGVVPAMVAALPLMERNSAGTILPGRLRGVETNEDGEFTINNLQPGDYILLAFPMKRELAPGYYVEGDVATMRWKDATVLDISETSNLSGIQIQLPKADGTRGFAKFRGRVVRDSEGTIKNGGSEVQSSEGISGALVYLIDQNGRISDYALTDNSGSFQVNELGEGDYQVIVDKIGFNTVVTSADFDYSSRSLIETDIPMSEGATTGVEDPLGVITQVDVYPNPAADFVSVRFNAVNGTGAITLYDNAGLQVLTQAITGTNGPNKVQLNTSSLASGVYFLRIQIDSFVSSVELRVVR